jgi:D-threo-aldose 1-dehydrogenase
MSFDAASWPRVGLGCAALGQPSVDDATAHAVVAAAIDRGVRFFDVAPLYGGGLGEERLGRALRALPRDDYVLCTKTGVTRPYGQPAMPRGATRPREFDRWDYSPEATRRSVRRSLERLCTDRLDLVHVHDAENHLDTCLDARDTLAALRDEGTVGGIGIGSNLVGPVATLLDRARFDAFLLAGRYTLLDQSGRPLLDRAQREGIAVIAGGAFNSGVLASWPPTHPSFDYAAASPAVLERVDRIGRLCAGHGVPLAAAALQFVLAHPAVRTLLLGPRSVAELEACLAALRHPVPDALWSELAAAGLVDAACPRPSRPSFPSTGRAPGPCAAPARH